MGKRYCLGHGRKFQNGTVQHLPMGNRRRRGFVEFGDLDDDGDDLGDGEGWAEVVVGSAPWVTGGSGGANK